MSFASFASFFRGSRTKVVLLFLHVAALTVFTAGASADATPSSTYRDLMAEGKFGQVEKLIRSALRQSGLSAEDRWHLQLDLAKSCRYQGNADKAVQVLQSVDQEYAREAQVRAELAWCLYVAEGRQKATPVLVSIRGHSEVESAFTATYLLARISADRGHFQSCEDLCKQALQLATRLDFYHNPYAWELRKIRADVIALRDEASDHVMAQRYGKDYSKYRRARILQAGRRYEQAIERYAQINAPILGDAARCYAGACLLGLGRVDQAVQHWRDFIEADKAGLYRGEVLYELGKVQLLSATNRDQMQVAEKTLRQAVEWFESVGQTTPQATTASVKEVLEAFPVPENAASRDRFGNFHRAYVGPETIVNRLTSTWYVTDLRLRAKLLHAFALHELDDEDRQSALESVITLNKQQGGALLRSGDVPDQLVIDGRDGAFFLPTRAWRAIAPQWNVKLHLACYLLVAGDLQWSRDLFSEVHRGVNGRADCVLEWSIAEYGLACITFQNGNLANAITELSRFETVLCDSPLAPLAILQAATLYTGQTGGWPDAKERYIWVARETSGTSLAPRAMLALAVAAVNAGDHQTATEACKELMNWYEESRYAPAAKTLLIHVTGSANIEGRRQKDSIPNGRIVPFARHMMIPSETDYFIDLTQVDRGDLLDYEISYAVRSGCRLSSFWYRVGLLEPQPAPVTESPVQFIRAPILGLAD